MKRYRKKYRSKQSQSRLYGKFPAPLSKILDSLQRVHAKDGLWYFSHINEINYLTKNQTERRYSYTKRVSEPNPSQIAASMLRNVLLSTYDFWQQCTGQDMHLVQLQTKRSLLNLHNLNSGILNFDIFLYSNLDQSQTRNRQEFKNEASQWRELQWVISFNDLDS